MAFRSHISVHIHWSIFIVCLMAGFLPSPTEDECQRCAELGIRNVLGEELLNESSNLIAQRVFFDSQNSIDPSSCPSCWASCRLHRSIQPARIFNEDPAWADPNSLLRNSHWTCMLSSQEVGRLDCKPGSRPMLQDTFGKGLAEDASGTVRIVQKIPNYAVVLAWLENCHKEHLSCQRKYSPCLKNIFLIDVEEEALVCYPSDAGKLIHYLALSYVWGSFEANYQVTGPGPIAIERLPQTVQDSIIVTKDLRQRYLWVDQVCINQDKKIKKNEQLGYMASIYGGAWATIVAADSNDSNSGLSRVRPESQRSHQLRIEFGNGNIMLQKLPSFEQQMAVSPWIQRGWTYQEALLSQRLVLFTKHQVYYSCNSMLCCEALDDEKTFGGSTKPLSYDMNDEVKNPPKIDLHFPTKKELRNNKLFEYERLVNLYCKRQLTHSQDILVAFSALLQRLEQLAFPTGFCHGLPKDNFPQSLLWRQGRNASDPDACPVCFGKPDAPARRKCETTFPSWSWIGWHLKSEVHFPHPVAEVEDEPREMVDLKPPLKIETVKGQILFDNLQNAHRMWQPRKRYHIHRKPSPRRLAIRSFRAPKAKCLIGDCTFHHEMKEGTKLKVRGIVLELPCRTSVSWVQCWICQQGYTKFTPEFDWRILDNSTKPIYESEWYVDECCDKFGDNGEEPRKDRFLLLECHRTKEYTLQLKQSVVCSLLILHWEDGNLVRGGILIIKIRAEDWQGFCTNSGLRVEEFWLA